MRFLRKGKLTILEGSCRSLSYITNRPNMFAKQAIIRRVP